MLTIFRRRMQMLNFYNFIPSVSPEDPKPTYQTFWFWIEDWAILKISVFDYVFIVIMLINIRNF